MSDAAEHSGSGAPAPQESPGASRSRPGRARSLLAIFNVTVLIFLIVAVIVIWRAKTHKKTGAAEDRREAVETGYLTATLFFGATGGDGFVTEAREVSLGAGGEEEAIQNVIAQLALGPTRSGVRLMPEGALPLRVFLDAQGTVTLDMNAAFRDGLLRGTTSETLAVRSLTKTLGSNFPTVKLLRILVEGQTSETLAGHVPIGEPIPVTL